MFEDGENIKEKIIEQVINNSLLDFLPSGIIIIDAERKILKFNKSAQNILRGLDNKIQIDQKIESVSVFRNNTLIFDCETCMKENIRVLFKKGIFSNQKKKFFLEYSVVPLTTKENNVQGCLVSFENKTNELVKQEELIKILTALDNTGVAIITTDPGYNLSYVNNSAVKLWGFPSNGDMISNRNIKDLFKKESVQKLINHAKRTVNDRVFYFSEELEAKKTDGQIFPVEVKATYITNVSEKEPGITLSVIDITDQISSRNELVLAKEMAEESDRLKSAFLANMSHEIRTPMNGILGFSNLLRKKNITEELRQKYIQLINANGELLVKIIDDIIDLSKIESGQLKIIKDECNIYNLLYELNSFFEKQKSKLNKKGVSLILNEPQNKELTIETDTLRLKQVLMNLIENAIKFTSQGRVEFGFIKKGNKHIQFYVNDTGIGIPYEKQQLIFDRFLQLDYSPSREYGGTGLGLTISKNLVEMMGGQIWVESKPGEGSNFGFVIPLKEVKSLVDFKVDKDILISEEYNWKGKTILVAEDELDNYYLLEEFLKGTGVNLIWAKDGLESVQKFKKNNIDLVLLDMKMPNLSGYEAAKEMRKVNLDIPIIAQTAYALTGDKEKILLAGCDDYISKPIEMEKTLHLISKYLK